MLSDFIVRGYAVVAMPYFFGHVMGGSPWCYGRGDGLGDGGGVGMTAYGDGFGGGCSGYLGHIAHEGSGHATGAIPEEDPDMAPRKGPRYLVGKNGECLWQMTASLGSA